MRRFIWSRRSRVYHRLESSVEGCNLDRLRATGDYETGEDAPHGLRLCMHCERQWEFEQNAAKATP